MSDASNLPITLYIVIRSIDLSVPLGLKEPGVFEVLAVSFLVWVAILSLLVWQLRLSDGSFDQGLSMALAKGVIRNPDYVLEDSSVNVNYIRSRFARSMRFHALITAINLVGLSFVLFSMNV
ncbi:hypothetical protein CR969_02490 [Candidatus Saccharibacteria bacterium]|nr:MAG: hypothetical protein CR969_02490 [Candidatus Saccharibacteria bacterium]